MSSKRATPRAQGLAIAERVGDAIFTAQNRGVLGFVELSLGDAVAAHEVLEPAVELLLDMGVGEFSIFPVMQNEIEALVALGHLDRAEELVDVLERIGRANDRAWALAVSARGRALVLAASGDLAGARASIERALREHERLPDPFERARTLLARGIIERRAKQKRVARDVLDEALALFERLGAVLWAEKTRDELRRLGLRTAPAELTETESRIAELAAAGRTNREIAETLFVTVKTVEANLSRVYRKLGVRSRTELARRVAREPAARP